jgi:hypothetical protein
MRIDKSGVNAPIADTWKVEGVLRTAIECEMLVV